MKDIDNMKDFYVEVFGCVPVREIQQLSGDWIERVTAVRQAEIRYVHLQFPGHGNEGSELELVQYLNPAREYDITPDTYGFGHLSFGVDDVHDALNAVIKAGGGSVGEVVTVQVPDRGLLTEVYATDPEGNIIELQCYA